MNWGHYRQQTVEGIMMTIWNRFAKRGIRRESQALVPPDQVLEQYQNEVYQGNLDETVRFFRDMLGQNSDFLVRDLEVFDGHRASIVAFENFAVRQLVNDNVLKPLMERPRDFRKKRYRAHELEEIVSKRALYYDNVRFERRLVKIMEALIRGDSIVLVEGFRDAILVGIRNVDKRSVSPPQTEPVIRGARDGFIESLGTNITLIRYRLQTANFRIKFKTVGRLTKTRVAVCYIEGICRPALVEEVEDRLEAIDIDAVLDSGILEQFIEDNHWSPFPQVQNTERPDKCVANLLEGRVVILVDGTPFALIVPAVFVQFYQTMDDYSERWVMGSLMRFIRLMALIFSLVFPSLYVSVIAFNPELIPTKFAVAVAGGRAGVPFPAVVEVVFMDLVMEILREATIRLPEQVGGALSIVGVLVIGQSAVAAGFVSPITVVVIALTTIGSFATPAYNAAIALRILRFVLTVLAGFFGLWGVMIGLILISGHMLSLRSFGVPYLSPFVPSTEWRDIKDALWRAPVWWMQKRPAQTHPINDVRLGIESKEDTLQRPSHTLDPVNPRKWR
ncbi:spore germination protein [Alicyclobacillus dauci]|uniref:Spore germination protein n=1 Tax=Alicyclobacillus dauci TaxID=1475485 RepID=A0ABY6YYR6_9BACL|nr:spore germination protein [Alicyclobacillus dauci]WAH35650.1 spore germination protein [Alicyclobacillus dauci]